MNKDHAVVALSALAQASRLDVFRLLVQAGTEGLAPGPKSERLGLPGATLSFHLKELRHAGLVTFRREGRSLIYAAPYEIMNDLLAYLVENCCQGDAAGRGPGACDTTAMVNARKGIPSSPCS